MDLVTTVDSRLSLPRIFDISNFALSRTIYPFSLSFSTWSNKKLLVSRISISPIFVNIEQIFRSLEQFSLVISNFHRKFQNFFAIFFSQISLFFNSRLHSYPQLYRQEWFKVSQIDFFCSFYIWLEYSMNALFKDHFTEKHGAFE